MQSQTHKAADAARAAHKPEAPAATAEAEWQPGMPITAPYQVLRHLLRSGAIQAKLTVSQPGDPLEQEADRTAEAVLRMPEPAPALSTSPAGIQRKCAACAGGGHTCQECAKKEKEKIQAKEAVGQTPAITPSVEAHVASLRGGGRPLPEAVRAFFEPRFGHDFSGVRVHSDASANEAASAVQARAFTLGKDIVFGAGRYAPQSAEGRRLLAHELVHVGQQGAASASMMRIPEPAANTAKEAPKKTNGPVPTWDTLPDHAKTDLEPRGFNEDWFKAKPDEVRMTVLNLYVKLKALGLWHLVAKDAGSTGESLTFTSSDAIELKEALRARGDFTNPEKGLDEWSSREYRAAGALHFKHFKGDPLDQVQAHIDGRGLLPSRPLLVGLLTLGVGLAVQALTHAITKKTYQDPYYIRAILLSQGFDKATLEGLPSISEAGRQEKPTEPPRKSR